MPLWVIKHREHMHAYWKENGPEIGVSGEWVGGKNSATKYNDEQKEFYTDQHGDLPTDFVWQLVSRRHRDALLINEGACNPAGISRSLHEAFREVIAEGGDTKAQMEDPACRLILHQLAFLLGMSGGYDLSEYGKMVDECKRIVEDQK